MFINGDFHGGLKRTSLRISAFSLAVWYLLAGWEVTTITCNGGSLVANWSSVWLRDPTWIKASFRALITTINFVKKQIEDRYFSATVLGSRWFIVTMILWYFCLRNPTAPAYEVRDLFPWEMFTKMVISCLLNVEKIWNSAQINLSSILKFYRRYIFNATIFTEKSTS